MRRFRPLLAAAALAATLAGCGQPALGPVAAAQAGALRARAMDPAVVAELRQALVPLATVMPGGDAADLAPVVRAIGDARVVGLGEATHGTAEFFRMKHRLFANLVERAGFTVFTIEANWASCLAADRYVKTGEGSAEDALAEMGFWTWRTAEVRDLLRWMRTYNQAHGPVLGVAGFDMQNPARSFDAVPRYMAALGPEAARAAAEAYAPFREAPTGEYHQLPEARKAACRAAIARVEALLDANRAALEAATSAEAYREARQHARVVRQAEAMEAPAPFSGPDLNARDAAMAENLAWLADEVHPGRRLVAWAHNAHVGAYTDFPGMPGWRLMGAHLKARYGAAYYPLGFSFDRGTVRAMRFTNGQMGGIEAMSVPPARPGSLDATFAAAGHPVAFLDVRTAARGGTLARWATTPGPLRHIGAGYDPQYADQAFLDTTLAATFDGMIHVGDTHASEPLPRSAGEREPAPGGARRPARRPALTI